MKPFFIIILTSLLIIPQTLAISDTFPPYEPAPDYTTYFSDGIPNNIYYCSPSGSNSAGDGSLGNPWFDLRGAQGTVGPGDLILFRGGTYAGITNGERSWYSENRLTTPGNPNDYIVFKNYPGETPVFENHDYFSMTLYSYQVLDGITFRGGISTYHPNIVIQNCDFSYGCAGQGDGNPAMIVFPVEDPYASNIVIRNNIFHDNYGNHVNGHGRSYAMCLFNSNVIPLNDDYNGGHTQVYYNTFYNFNAATSQKYIIYGKDHTFGLDVAYNRFYNSNAFVIGGFGQGDRHIQEHNIHHNLVYNCDGLGFYWDLCQDGSWHNNVIIDDGYAAQPYYYDGPAGTSFGFGSRMETSPSSYSWGDVYNNAFYVDIPSMWHYSGENPGYWTWVDYNAYPSIAVRDNFENKNMATQNWQQHALITPNTISVDSNYFATIPDSSPLRGAGRYGDSIGGFTFGGAPSCNENWQCTDWSICSGGTQTRICTDINLCGTTSSKPPETQSCTTTQTCSQLAGSSWDCCTGSETCPGTTYSGASDCSGTCCSQTCFVPSNDIFFTEDFESGSAQTFLSDYHQTFSQDNGYSVQSNTVASGNYAGMYTFYQGQPGTGYATQHIGDSPRSPVAAPGTHFNDLYIQFKLMHSSGFDFSAGNNKFMIIGTEDSRSHPEPCCNPPVAHYITLYAEQDSGGYFFNLEGNNKKDTNSDRWYYPYIERAYIQPGQWHTIEVRLRLNDADQENGIYQMWIDGNQVADYNNILYRVSWDGTYGSDFNYGTNFVMLSTYTNSGVSQQQHFYYDDIMFSTSYIGTVPSPYCGDGICNNGETPTSCSVDCGPGSQTCLDQGGDECSLSETCSVGFISASDTSRCCPQPCQTAGGSEIIIDNSDPGFSTTGSWWASSYENPYGQGSLGSNINEGSTATWIPNLPQIGTWEVYVWWTAGPQRANDATYTISHAQGSNQVEVNQLQNGGQWNLLGAYTFNTGTSGSVTLSDSSSDPQAAGVCADAVRFVSSTQGTTHRADTHDPFGCVDTGCRWTYHETHTGSAR